MRRFLNWPNHIKKTDRELPEVYLRLFSDYTTISKDPAKIEEFQRDLEFRIMKTALSTKPKVVTELVVTNLLVEDIEKSEILKDLVL